MMRCVRRDICSSGAFFLSPCSNAFSSIVIRLLHLAFSCHPIYSVYSALSQLSQSVSAFSGANLFSLFRSSILFSLLRFLICFIMVESLTFIIKENDLRFNIDLQPFQVSHIDAFPQKLTCAMLFMQPYHDPGVLMDRQNHLHLSGRSNERQLGV